MSDKGLNGHFGDGKGGNLLPSSQSQIAHIFNDRPGHLPDTFKNRQLLLDVANDPNSYVGKDKYGNEWHVRIEQDGSQVWVTSRNGTVQNGGKNNPLRKWDDETGLNDNPFRKRKL